MAGGKRKFWNHNHKSCRQYVALEHGTLLLSCQGGNISLHFHWPPWVRVILFDLSFAHFLVTMTSDLLMSNTANSTIVPSICSKRSWPLKENRPHLIVHKSHFTTLYLPVSRRWCGKHYGPPSTKTTSCRLRLIIQESGLETPFRYLGACMPQWQVLHIRREVFIIGLRWDNFTGVRCRLMHSHAVDYTCSTLRAIVIIGGTSRVC